MTPLPKGRNAIAPAIRKASAGQDCTLRIEGVCRNDPAYTVGAQMQDRIEELEAELAKSVELALEECPFRCGTPNYDNWWRNRRATLAEIKGGKDGN